MDQESIVGNTMQQTINCILEKKNFILHVACSLFLLGILAVYANQLYLSANALYSTDFFKFYESARFYFQGQNLYDKVIRPLTAFEASVLHAQTLVLSGNLNPPFFTLLMLPMAWLTYGTSFIIWSICSLIATVLGIVLTFKTYPALWNNILLRHWALAGFLLYFPTYANLRFGQVTSFLLLLTAIAWLASRKQQARLAGIMLGLALSIKAFYGLFLVFFFIRRQWRLLFYMGSTYLICAASALWIFGLSSYKSYYLTLKDIIWYSASWNGSLLGFLTRIFGGNNEGNHPIFNLHQITHPLYLILSFLLACYFIWTSWLTPSMIKFGLLTDSNKIEIQQHSVFNITEYSTKENSPDTKHDNTHSNHHNTVQKPGIVKYLCQRIHQLLFNNRWDASEQELDYFDWGFSLTIVLMLLITPLGWVYYFSLLIIPFITILRISDKLPSFNLNITLLVIIILMSSMPGNYQRPAAVIQTPMILTWGGYYFYALTLLFGLLVFIHYQLFNKNISYMDFYLSPKFSASLQLILYLLAAFPSLIVFGIAIS